MSAVGATVKVASRLNAVADNLAAAMLTLRRQRVDGAFETIEIVRDAIIDDFERLVVFVSANFTLHNEVLLVGYHSESRSRLSASRVALAI